MAANSACAFLLAMSRSCGAGMEFNKCLLAMDMNSAWGSGVEEGTLDDGVPWGAMLLRVSWISLVREINPTAPLPFLPAGSMVSFATSVGSAFIVKDHIRSLL
eukprot:CAMPEP_0117659284 /NCGR_PEP_ID=MMETSP0804-20121206/6341_1 /TAXON_ID=1074897 /ORGANISM="Tetraselmis astigmatica, Strain CCMP880" /LENGTH=102 /DNA_ID=CAMNT_0005465913 /DNA_START=337 /DNA_END=645 /DNA_ORIENTATION=-